VWRSYARLNWQRQLAELRAASWATPSALALPVFQQHLDASACAPSDALSSSACASCTHRHTVRRVQQHQPRSSVVSPRHRQRLYPTAAVWAVSSANLALLSSIAVLETSKPSLAASRHCQGCDSVGDCPSSIDRAPHLGIHDTQRRTKRPWSSDFGQERTGYREKSDGS
jgi:hypothetical protein